MVVNPKNFQLIFLGIKTYMGLHLNIKRKKLNATDHVKLLVTEVESK